MPVIQKDDVEFARSLILYYYSNVEEVVDKYIFENKTQMNSQKILNVINDNGGSMPLIELYKKTRSLSKRERDGILEDLISSEMVSRDLESIGGVQTLMVRTR